MPGGRYPWAVRAGGPLLGGGGLPPIIDFNPVGGGDVLPTSTFTRASGGPAALYFDGTQYQEAAVDEARFQTFAVVPRHFLWEPLATNKMETQDFTDPVWAKAAIDSVTNNGINDINLTEYEFDIGTINGAHNLFDLYASPGAAGSGYLIAKEGTGGRYIGLQRGASGTVDFAIFDLQNGVVSEEGSGVTNTFIYHLANGWYLCGLVTTSTSRVTVIGFSDVPTPGTVTPSFVGANETWKVCHIQIEDTDYFTSPMRTSGTILTRQPDVLTDADWPVETSAVVDVTLGNAITSAINMLGFGSSAASVLAVDDPATARLVNGGINSPITAGTPYEFERHGFGMSLKTNEGIITDDENNDNTDITGTPAQGAIYFGGASDQTGQPCWLHRARIFDQTQTVEELRRFL